jgi:hypothetical protein
MIPLTLFLNINAASNKGGVTSQTDALSELLAINIKQSLKVGIPKRSLGTRNPV